jgi:hypothetical protein
MSSMYSNLYPNTLDYTLLRPETWLPVSRETLKDGTLLLEMMLGPHLMSSIVKKIVTQSLPTKTTVSHSSLSVHMKVSKPKFVVTHHSLILIMKSYLSN